MPDNSVAFNRTKATIFAVSSQGALSQLQDVSVGALEDVHSTETADPAERFSEGRLIQFCESNGPWQPVPQWADFLIRFGFNWMGSELKRRVSVISMPCESAAAGLISLGVMRRRFAIVGANDSIAHYQRIERLAANHHEETFLRHKEYKGRFFVESKGRDGVIWVRGERTDNCRLSNRTKLTRTIILPSNATDWHFDGEAPIETAHGAVLPHCRIYETLVSEPPAITENFTKSDSWICLACRVAGESVSKSAFTAIRFKHENSVADLSELLTIQDWSPRSISRLNFFNTRTAELDRNTGLTGLVVADGDGAFLKVLEAPKFTSSDVIGVVHRAVTREVLEAVGFKLSSLTQWYVPDENSELEPPVGITVSTLRQK